MRTYTQKQRDFIRYYMETGDLIRSAIRAGYKSPEIGLHRKRLQKLISTMETENDDAHGQQKWIK